MHAATTRSDGPTARASALAPCALEDGIDPMIIAGRRRYLEAFYLPAAVLAMEEGEVRLAGSNRAFDRIWERGAASELLPWARTFLAEAREHAEHQWQQAGVGGRHFRAHMSRLPPFGSHRDRAMLSLIDRTAEVETARSLRAEMLHDSLTGLPNRLAFTEALDAVIESGGDELLGVLVLDLNRFSRINECVGALAGDELIITVARRLVSALRAGDMLARMAGNEFAVLVRAIEGPMDVLTVARRLEAALDTPIRLADLDIRVDCAIGCALRLDRQLTAGELTRDAQVALKRAKTSGLTEIYEPGQIAHARRRFSIETELRRAIEADGLTLAFQPLVELGTGVVSGFEALARWEHPAHGVIQPAEFIAVAEDCGLIVPVGRWALAKAIETLARWDRSAGRPLDVRMAVNVSPVQLARDDVGAAVAEALAAHGIAGKRLTLELTESSIVGDPERASRVLGSLHAQGCHVAMDDFGTGYSSLSCLQKLPIDILKIDRSFVTGMHSDGDAVAIIRAILSLAQTLGMSTTAEGVEDAETAETLRALGCTTGQGYTFARPLPDPAAFAFLRRAA